MVKQKDILQKAKKCMEEANTETKKLAPDSDMRTAQYTAGIFNINSALYEQNRVIIALLNKIKKSLES